MTLFAAARLPREILFGKGQRRVLANVAVKYGRRAFICTDERFASTDVFAEMMASLKDASVNVLVHDGTQPDVPRDSVGASIAEVAAQTGLSETAVKVGVHRAVKALGEEIGEDRAD